MNQLINHEAVYRTAPATPGLLNIWGHAYKHTYRHFNTVNRPGLRAGSIEKQKTKKTHQLLISNCIRLAVS